MFTKESISKVYFNVHDKVNKFLDGTRRVVLLHDIPLLIKTVIVLLFTLSIGSCFSSLTLVVLCNFIFIN
jgi:hypothetical protein